MQVLAQIYFLAAIVQSVGPVLKVTEQIMRSNIQMEKPNVDGDERQRSIRRTILRPLVCSVVAAFGIFGGVSALFIGLICVVLHGLLTPDRVFDNVGTVLLIAAIPMILIGSIFVDEIEK